MSRPPVREKLSETKAKRGKQQAPQRRSTRRAARVREIEARKLPRQERSRLLVEAILQAAAEMFAERGYARTTTNKIAERAGVSVGSLYQYFPNKDSLLAALLAVHRAEVHPIIDAALARLADPAVPLEGSIRQLLGELLEAHRRNPAVTRALSASVIRESPAAAEHEKGEEGEKVAREICEVLVRRPDVRDGDHLAMAALLAQTTSQLTRWLAHDPPVGIEADTLLEETVQLLVRFLRR
jgi:AcrR family transcriptional regulator